MATSADYLCWTRRTKTPLRIRDFLAWTLKCLKVSPLANGILVACATSVTIYRLCTVRAIKTEPFCNDAAYFENISDYDDSNHIYPDRAIVHTKAEFSGYLLLPGNRRAILKIPSPCFAIICLNAVCCGWCYSISELYYVT